VSSKIGDPELAWLFENCYPNTLDTTIEFGTFEGKPDTAVITGDIPAMWLRDSSARCGPISHWLRKTSNSAGMLEGIIRRQARCILIDPYANAFMANLDAPPLEWSRTDATDMKAGCWRAKVGARLALLSDPSLLRVLARNGDSSPFDKTWHAAMKLVIETMLVQQRRQGPGPYHFQRISKIATETLPADGYGARCGP